ncbi:MAG: hypothetical protein ACOYB3_05545 [Azonexus sp.]
MRATKSTLRVACTPRVACTVIGDLAARRRDLDKARAIFLAMAADMGIAPETAAQIFAASLAQVRRGGRPEGRR